MGRRNIHDILSVIAFLSSFVFLFGFGCDSPRSHDFGDTKVSPLRNIDSVKEIHVKELMSVPGVVGVYVGELSNHSPCIGVMVVKKTSEIEQKLPKTLEGYPVRIDETGIVKPMVGGKPAKK